MLLSTLRKWGAVLMLLGLTGGIGYQFYVLNFVSRYGPLDLRGNILVVSAILGGLLASIGLVMNRAWGRWLALAVGVSFLSLLSFLLLPAGSLAVEASPGLLLAALLGPLGLILLLSGESMRQRFAAREEAAASAPSSPRANAGFGGRDARCHSGRPPRSRHPTVLVRFGR